MNRDVLPNTPSQPKVPAPKPAVLWDRSRAHRERLGRSIARLRRTGRA